MTLSQGWLGTSSELYTYLRDVGCDTDEQGKFIVRGNITSFQGIGDEFCVGSDAEYRVRGGWCNLAESIGETNGIRVAVL